MSLALEGKNALVTGASRGIGKAIAERLAGDGAAVVINYSRNEQLAQGVVNKILGKGGKAIAIQADISKSADVGRLFSEAEKAMGRLDIVVANAGVHILKPSLRTPKRITTIFSTSTPRACFSRCSRRHAACATVVALSSFRRAARRCISPTTRFISEAKGPSSSLPAPWRSNSARAMLR
jgi:3-oxoacyl-[acyl-carrier protein] reductase